MDSEDMLYMYNGISPRPKKGEILPFVPIWMDLKRYYSKWNKQTKANTVWFHLYMESVKQNKWTNRTKQKQSHSYGEQTDDWQGVEVGRGRREIGEGD